MNENEMPREEVFDFRKLDPHDGFKIKRSTAGGEIGLHLTVRLRDELFDLGLDEGVPTVELARWRDAEDQVSLGEADRFQTVLEAVARYMTVGGSVNDLLGAIYSMKMTPIQLVYPGWHYSRGETLYDPDADAIVVQHLFVANVDEGTLTPAVVWIENSFIDLTTLGRLARAEEEGVTGLGATVASRGRQEAALQLSPPEDPPGSEHTD